jgi:Tfp pilus assembly protein PilF
VKYSQGLAVSSVAISNLGWVSAKQGHAQDAANCYLRAIEMSEFQPPEFPSATPGVIVKSRHRSQFALRKGLPA